MSKLPRDSNNSPIPVLSPRLTEVVGFSGSAQNSAVFSSAKIVRLSCTEACYIEIGLGVTATVASSYFPQDSVEYVFVGGGHRVSAIQRTTAGNLHITEVI